MSEKLTQYPWVAELYENSDMGGIYIYPEDGTCYPVVEDVSPEFVHLIASAPDLYEALSNLLGVVYGDGGTNPDAKGMAERALARARGE